MIKTKKYDLPVNYNNLEYYEKRIVRLQYIKEQNNLCQYCKMSLNESPDSHVMSADIYWDVFPIDFKNHPIHLHHNHNTGMTIGALHMRCNAYLWIYKKE